MKLLKQTGYDLYVAVWKDKTPLNPRRSYLAIARPSEHEACRRHHETKVSPWQTALYLSKHSFPYLVGVNWNIFRFLLLSLYAIFHILLNLILLNTFSWHRKNSMFCWRKMFHLSTEATTRIKLKLWSARFEIKDSPVKGSYRLEHL